MSEGKLPDHYPDGSRNQGKVASFFQRPEWHKDASCRGLAKLYSGNKKPSYSEFEKMAAICAGCCTVRACISSAISQGGKLYERNPTLEDKRADPSGNLQPILSIKITRQDTHYAVGRPELGE